MKSGMRYGFKINVTNLFTKQVQPTNMKDEYISKYQSKLTNITLESNYFIQKTSIEPIQFLIF